MSIFMIILMLYNKGFGLSITGVSCFISIREYIVMKFNILYIHQERKYMLQSLSHVMVGVVFVLFHGVHGDVQ